MRRALLSVLSALALVATGVVGALAVGGTGTVDPPPRIAFLANGIVPADALAAGGIAGQLGAPLFTTRADVLNDDARDGIKAYAPELVIVLGGPVAIQEPVVNALAAAVGLAVVTTPAPSGGIVRVAGGDRFATARAVAGLLADYDPAFLPVGATALGAVDADLLDGREAADFALSDTSCADGEAVTGIDADGTPVCAPVQASGDVTETVRTLVPWDTRDDMIVRRDGGRTQVGHSSGADTYVLIPLAPQMPPGVANLELVDLTVCLDFGAADLGLMQVATAGLGGAVSSETFDDVLTDDTCTSIPLASRHIVDATTMASVYVSIDDGRIVGFGPISATWRPTTVTPADNQSVDPTTSIPAEP